MEDSLLLESLMQEVKILTAKVDTFQRNESLIEMKYKLAEKAETIDKVNGFYQTAWDDIIYLLSIIGGILIIIIPVLINRFQRQNNKDLIEGIRLSMNNEFDFKIETLSEENSKNIEEVTSVLKVDIGKEATHLKNEIEKVKESAKKGLSETDANLFYLQGRSQLVDLNYPHAVVSFILSVQQYIGTDVEERIDVVLGYLLEALKKIKSLGQEYPFYNKMLDWKSLDKTGIEVLASLSEIELNEKAKSKLDEIIELYKVSFKNGEKHKKD